jgi:hypothetical protein
MLFTPRLRPPWITDTVAQYLRKTSRLNSLVSLNVLEDHGTDCERHWGRCDRFRKLRLHQNARPLKLRSMHHTSPQWESHLRIAIANIYACEYAGWNSYAASKLSLKEMQTPLPTCASFAPFTITPDPKQVAFCPRNFINSFWWL